MAELCAMRKLGIILLLAAWACARARGEEELINGIAAIANDTVITVQDVRQYAAEVVESYRRTYQNNPAVFQQKQTEALTDALQQLIDRQLILADFKTAGFVLPENLIDDQLKEQIRQQFGDRVTLLKGLKAQGITYETYRQRERNRIITSIMERKNVRENILISPAKIEHSYQTNLSRFKLGDQVKLRMIVLSRPTGGSGEATRRLLQEIRVKIEEGAPFSEMAAIYSEGSQRKEGGLWGWIEESKLKKGLSEIAFTMPVKQCSPVVGLARAGDEAYWIFQYDSNGKAVRARKFTERDVFLEEKSLAAPADPEDLPALPVEFYLLQIDERQTARTRALEEVKEELERELVLQERARLQKRWMERLRAKMFILPF